MNPLHEHGPYYDRKRNRLVYISREATPDMWHERWRIDEHNIRARLVENQDPVVKITSRFVKPGEGTILEGGCGYGGKVSALMEAGYAVVGIDFDSQTVSILNKVVPELDIRLGDVRDMPVDDASVVGYWSFGVIEHFYDGCNDIVSEMVRVLKPGGYLFLGHPYMSPLRRIKAALGLYPVYIDQGRPVNFYQFALDHRAVVNLLKTYGFEPCLFKRGPGLLGFNKEAPLGLLLSLNAYKGRNKLVTFPRYLFNKMLAPFSAHGCLMVFRLLKKDRQEPRR